MGGYELVLFKARFGRRSLSFGGFVRSGNFVHLYGLRSLYTRKSSQQSFKS